MTEVPGSHAEHHVLVPGPRARIELAREPQLLARLFPTQVVNDLNRPLISNHCLSGAGRPVLGSPEVVRRRATRRERGPDVDCNVTERRRVDSGAGEDDQHSARLDDKGPQHDQPSIVPFGSGLPRRSESGATTGAAGCSRAAVPVRPKLEGVTGIASWPLPTFLTHRRATRYSLSSGGGGLFGSASRTTPTHRWRELLQRGWRRSLAKPPLRPARPGIAATALGW